MLYSYLEDEFSPIEFNKCSCEYYVYLEGEKIYVDYEVYAAYFDEYNKVRQQYCKDKNSDLLFVSLDDFEENLVPYIQSISEVDVVCVNHAISSLSLAEQKLVYYIFYYGYTQDHVAFKFGISQSAICYRLKLILRKLRRFLLAS